jgi:hypothetical protein
MPGWKKLTKNKINKHFFLPTTFILFQEQEVPDI